MRRKSLAIISLIYFTSVSAFAMQVDSAKLTSHKEWGASNIKQMFKETQPDQFKVKMLMSQAKQQLNSDTLVALGVKVTNVEANPVGSNSSISADNWLLIFNETSSYQSYRINHSICPVKFNDDGSVGSETCSYTSDTVFVEPHSFYNPWGTTVVNWVPTEAGKHGFSIGISVQNEENTTLIDSGDFAAIDIPETQKVK